MEKPTKKCISGITTKVEFVIRVRCVIFLTNRNLLTITKGEHDER